MTALVSLVSILSGLFCVWSTVSFIDWLVNDDDDEDEDLDDGE